MVSQQSNGDPYTVVILKWDPASASAVCNNLQPHPFISMMKYDRCSEIKDRWYMGQAKSLCSEYNIKSKRHQSVGSPLVLYVQKRSVSCLVHFISSQNIRKTCLYITCISLTQPFWNRDQNFEMIGQLANKLWQTRFGAVWALGDIMYGDNTMTSRWRGIICRNMNIVRPNWV